MSSSLQSPPATATPSPNPSPSATEIYTLIRKTFNQTWKDYYEWKPPSTLPIINGELEKGSKSLDEQIIQGHKALSDDLKRLLREAQKEEKEQEIAQAQAQNGEKQVEKEGFNKKPIKFIGSQKLTIQSVNNGGTNTILWYNKNSKSDSISGPSSNSKSKTNTIITTSTTKKTNLVQLPSSTSNIPIEGNWKLLYPEGYKKHENVPPYFFCIKGEYNIYKEDERYLPFTPIFADHETFNEHKYFEFFQGESKFATWRDPEIDIIQIETLSRIQKQGEHLITSAQIDETRILPLTVGQIENLDLSRDLPPFPLKPSSSSSSSSYSNNNLLSTSTSINNIRPSKRKWNEPIPTQQEKDDIFWMDHFGEAFCPSQGCEGYGCQRHTFIRNDDHMLIHEDSMRQRPKRLAYIPKKKLENIKLDVRIEPCGDNCYSHHSITELSTKASEAEVWTEDATQIIIEAISRETEFTGEDICMLSLLSANRTCFDVAVQILVLAREDPLNGTNVVNNNHSHTAIAPHRKNKKMQWRKIIPQHIPNIQNCEHDGPCSTANCWCFKNKWMCGRNCGCVKNCPLRFSGCTCHKPLNTVSKNGTTITTNLRKICLPHSCRCAKFWRECDPEKCDSCGAAEELESSENTKHGHHQHHRGINDERTHRCGNVDIQKGIIPKMRIGASAIAGYGVFAEENIQKGCHVGEYIGEVISHAEGDKRDKINDQIRRHYMFRLNTDSELDSGSYGNFTRFFNSAKDDMVNLTAKTRFIKKGEELRFDYGDSFDEYAVKKS
ncbi:uncharacterized protein L201_000761 [Kwoniella dendrophila CBS 6074]|uniref:SET domain-containing protein n=1 Tax=Kwoniella dendrophila CBS 6074 TaxID=1295534 RepID=A0AAX4JLY5_9TREE